MTNLPTRNTNSDRKILRQKDSVNQCFYRTNLSVASLRNHQPQGVSPRFRYSRQPDANACRLMDREETP